MVYNQQSTNTNVLACAWLGSNLEPTKKFLVGINIF